MTVTKKLENPILNGKIGPTLLRFALPFMISNLLQSIYGAVDLLVVGRYADSSAVSAVSIGSQLLMIATCLVMGISVGGTVLIGQRIGAGDKNGAAKAIGNLAVLFLLLALIMTPVMILGNHAMVALMQTPVEAVEQARRYLFICSAGLIFITGYNAVSGIFRGMGDSRTPVYFIVIACIVNVVLDFVLTGYFKMGVSGAAFATIIAQAVSFVCGLGYMAKKGLGVPFSRESFRPGQTEFRAILIVGLPLALQDVLVHLSFLIISAIINTLGLVASAAVGVAEKFMGFAFIPPSAFSSAVATMVAQNVGAGQHERAYESMKKGILFSVICGGLICALCEICPNALIGIFTTDPAVIEAGSQYIRTYAIDCVLTGFVFNMNAYFNGNGKSMICFAHSMAATFLVRIPVTWIMGQLTNGSLLPMGLAAPAASLLSMVVCFFYLRKMRRGR